MIVAWSTKRQPFKSRTQGSRRTDFPCLAEASAEASTKGASLFYERGFFGLVWFEGSIRKVRDLKNW